ncbi:DUF257 family protein [Thermococcus aciditolerans]|uniref:Uncharacterized protein n=1 Tax=Thermococcus aciditolerans TaxID=2598455 RepID=A0A5C0SLA8_9EURY|nr:DUF257 family protein [Thermococcus aciditolerans]QEK15265.1 hypothetical protein FPV09_09335 [Thermococcus aciditolerans]
MVDAIEKLLSMRDAVVLVEYHSTDHPEWILKEILDGWENMGIFPLVVDIGDTLHGFVQNLRFSGQAITVDTVPVIKIKGVMNVGHVLGNIDVVDDFEYHLALYSKLARKVPERSRNHTVVLGMEKFTFTFLEDPQKLERYFETITRKYLSIVDKMNFLFLNVDIASPYLIKGLEEDSDYVMEIVRSGLELKKMPGGW